MLEMCANVQVYKKKFPFAFSHLSHSKTRRKNGPLTVMVILWKCPNSGQQSDHLYYRQQQPVPFENRNTVWDEKWKKVTKKLGKSNRVKNWLILTFGTPFLNPQGSAPCTPGPPVGFRFSIRHINLEFRPKIGFVNAIVWLGRKKIFHYIIPVKDFFLPMPRALLRSIFEVFGHRKVLL